MAATLLRGCVTEEGKRIRPNRPENRGSITVGHRLDPGQVAQRLKKSGVPISDGLSEEELRRIERLCSFKFPPDLRSFLHHSLPSGAGFPDWRHFSDTELLCSVDLRRILGSSPASYSSAAASIPPPKLVPLFSHFYLPCVPNLADNPVFFISHSHVLLCSPTLSDFFDSSLIERTLLQQQPLLLRHRRHGRCASASHVGGASLSFHHHHHRHQQQQQEVQQRRPRRTKIHDSSAGESDCHNCVQQEEQQQQRRRSAAAAMAGEKKRSCKVRHDAGDNGHGDARIGKPPRRIPFWSDLAQRSKAAAAYPDPVQQQLQLLLRQDHEISPHITARSPKLHKPPPEDSKDIPQQEYSGTIMSSNSKSTITDSDDSQQQEASGRLVSSDSKPKLVDFDDSLQQESSQTVLLPESKPTFVSSGDFLQQESGSNLSPGSRSVTDSNENLQQENSGSKSSPQTQPTTDSGGLKYSGTILSPASMPTITTDPVNTEASWLGIHDSGTKPSPIMRELLPDSGARMNLTRSDSGDILPPPLPQNLQKQAEAAAADFCTLLQEEAKPGTTEGQSPNMTAAETWLGDYFKNVGKTLRNGGWKEADIEEMVASAAIATGIADSDNTSSRSSIKNADALFSCLQNSGWSVQDAMEALGLELQLQEQLQSQINRDATTAQQQQPSSMRKKARAKLGHFLSKGMAAAA